jgi:hypothetical protein
MAMMMKYSIDKMIIMLMIIVPDLINFDAINLYTVLLYPINECLYNAHDILLLLLLHTIDASLSTADNTSNIKVINTTIHNQYDCDAFTL